MADLITLEYLKAFSRVDFPDDDSVLESLIGAASEYVTKYLKDKFDEIVPDPANAPERVKVATAVWCEHIYDQRGTEMNGDPLQYGEPPMIVRALLQQDRRPTVV